MNYEVLNAEARQKMEGMDAWFKGLDERPVAKHTVGTIVNFQMGDQMPSMPAYITARHEYQGEFKYDIRMAIRTEEGWVITRLYNIEERWLKDSV